MGTRMPRRLNNKSSNRRSIDLQIESDITRNFSLGRIDVAFGDLTSYVTGRGWRYNWRSIQSKNKLSDSNGDYYTYLSKPLSVGTLTTVSLTLL